MREVRRTKTRDLARYAVFATPSEPMSAAWIVPAGFGIRLPTAAFRGLRSPYLGVAAHDRFATVDGDREIAGVCASASAITRIDGDCHDPVSS